LVSIRARTDAIAASVRSILDVIDPDPTRSGIADTPGRVARAWEEWTAGYDVEPETLLRTFDDGAERYDQLVIVSGIRVVSLCEHHLAPFHGIAHVGYIPRQRIVGLSKIARVVDAYARRLQVQERLTTQVAELLERVLDPVGVGVLVRCAHTCMSTRGVRLHGSVTTTTDVRGVLRTDASAKAEFLSLCAQADAGALPTLP
jgi:GTP cyclohydrolase I